MFMTIVFGEMFIQAFVHYLIELLIFVAEVAMFPRLSSNPCTQTILLPQSSRLLGLQTWATEPN